MSLLSILGFKKPEPIDLTNAVLLDVRSPSEYASGHAPNSINIPLTALSYQLGKVPKEKKIVTCCASGMRSASAASLLRENGYDAQNGGPWTNFR